MLLQALSMVQPTEFHQEINYMHVRSDPNFLANLRGTYDDLNVFETQNDESRKKKNGKRKKKTNILIFSMMMMMISVENVKISLSQIYKMIEIFIFTLTGWNETTENSDW